MLCGPPAGVPECHLPRPPAAAARSVEGWKQGSESLSLITLQENTDP